MRRAFALLAAVALAGCTNMATAPDTPAPALKLISYDSCDELLSSVRQAAKNSVGPYGFAGGGRDLMFGAPGMARAEGDSVAAQAMPPAKGQDYSGTNTHERDVDEPDLVKTDGKRIVMVGNGTLHIIDAASKRETHRVPVEKGASQILLHDDRVLVLSSGGTAIPFDAPALRSPHYPYRTGTQVQLIDISGMPKVIGEYEIEARLIDARQVGGTARIVVSNTPAIEFPLSRDATGEDARLLANREAIDKAPIDAWLPAITVNGKSAKLDCSDVSRPQEFSGASMVTLLSFELGASTLDEGEPVAVLADGDTVYGSGSSLYLANDQRWRGWRLNTWNNRSDFKSQTDLYQFDVTSAQPAYVASGSVPGWLLNQYSMSEFDGVLRVATTNADSSASSVYTLRRNGGALKRLGEVGGLGKDERIYSVRFVGKVGYVVTFRQTDPLYTIDLSNPARPRVIGELKIPGYSAYLHPVSDSRLIGVGQDATDQGRTQGTQVSLFDVSDLADPKRVAQHKVPRSHSEAEHDPHAFLYWPATRLLVIPVNANALLLKVEDNALHQLGTISHDSGHEGQIRRSLVIGETLWTISDRGAMASTLDGAQRLAWLAL